MYLNKIIKVKTCLVHNFIILNLTVETMIEGQSQTVQCFMMSTKSVLDTRPDAQSTLPGHYRHTLGDKNALFVKKSCETYKSLIVSKTFSNI